MRLLASLAMFGVLMIGCGGAREATESGDSEHILRVSGSELTEDEWRADIRASSDLRFLCKSLVDLSIMEAAKSLADLLDSAGLIDATNTRPSDIVRLGYIFRDECRQRG